MSSNEALKEQLRSLRIERATTQGPSKPPRRRWPMGVAAVVVLALAAWARYRGVASTPTVTLATPHVVRGDAPITAPVLSGSGYVITAEKTIAIGVRVPGRIERFFVDEGDHVKTGDLLARLDDRDYRAQAGRAEASLRLARANAKLADADRRRIRTLFGQGVTSRQELDEADSKSEVAAATIAQAENDVRQAQANLDDTRLASPVNGVVLAKLRGVGEIAVPGGFSGSGDLLRLADLSELRAEIDVSEADLGNVYADQGAEVVPDAYPSQRYDAKVVKIYPQVNRQKGTLKVEVRIEKPDPSLLPDMSVRVTFLAPPLAKPVAGAPPVVLIPKNALHQGAGGAYVWLLAGDRVARRDVTVDRELGAEVPVTKGLDGSERVITSADGELRDGMTARTKPAS